MKHIFFLSFCILHSAFCICPAQAQTVDPYLPDPNPVRELPGWLYAWGDEFNTEGQAVNDSLWAFEKGFIRGNEKQYYQQANATITGGRLLISGRKEVVSNEFYDPSSSDYRKNTKYSEYTSASILGKRKRLFLYGRIEVRAKVDVSNGAFPAIWTCGYNKDWPQNGEIDIMEYYLTGGNPVFTSNFCVGGDQNGSDGYWAQKWKSVFTPRSYYEGKDPDWTNKYHVFRMDWTTDSIKLFVDDELRNSLRIDAFKNWDGSICFNNPQFMMLNLAIKDHGAGIADAIKFEVDYFRVYQKIPDLEKPTAPAGLTVSNIAATSCKLVWRASTDNKGVFRYDVYNNGLADSYYRASTSDTILVLTGLKPSSTYNLRVCALDSTGNYSDVSNIVNVVTLPAVTATNGEIYQIANKNSGKILSPLNGATTDNAYIVQVTPAESNMQKWEFTNISGNYWTAKNVANNLYLDVENASTANGAKIVQRTYTGANSQHWQLVRSGDFYNFINRNSGKYMDISDASKAENGSDIQWSSNGGDNQLWELVKTSVQTGVVTPLMSAVALIYCMDKTIRVITDEKATVAVYSLTGNRIVGKTISGTQDIAVQQTGLYIVKVNEKAVKVIVK